MSKVEEALRSINGGRNYALRVRTGQELMGSLSEVGESLLIGTIGSTVGSSLKVVDTTAWLSARSPGATIGIRHCRTSR